MSWIFSIFAGLSARAWLVLGAVAAFAIWTFYVYGVGYSAADGMWKARELEARIAKLERELRHDVMAHVQATIWRRHARLLGAGEPVRHAGSRRERGVGHGR